MSSESEKIAVGARLRDGERSRFRRAGAARFEDERCSLLRNDTDVRAGEIRPAELGNPGRQPDPQRGEGPGLRNPDVGPEDRPFVHLGLQVVAEDGLHRQGLVGQGEDTEAEGRGHLLADDLVVRVEPARAPGRGGFDDLLDLERRNGGAVDDDRFGREDFARPPRDGFDLRRERLEFDHVAGFAEVFERQESDAFLSQDLSGVGDRPGVGLAAGFAPELDPPLLDHGLGARGHERGLHFVGLPQQAAGRRLLGRREEPHLDFVPQAVEDHDHLRGIGEDFARGRPLPRGNVVDISDRHVRNGDDEPFIGNDALVCPHGSREDCGRREGDEKSQESGPFHLRDNPSSRSWPGAPGPA
jgi:hypothetical protein